MERLRDEVVNIKELAEKVEDHAKRLARVESAAQEATNEKAIDNQAALEKAQAKVPTVAPVVTK